MSRLPRFDFASQGLGRELLARRDAFVSRLSPFDRAARCKCGQAIDEPDFLGHVAGCVQAWPDQARALTASALSRIAPKLEALALPWPEAVTLVHTDGREEGGAAYTRGETVVLPPAVFSNDRIPDLDRLLLHELFHVLTRSQPALKQALYAAIGFYPCTEPVLPESLAARKITNPDAPVNDFAIKLSIEGSPATAVPLLLADASGYDPARGGEFFEYLQLRFWFERDGKRWLAEPDEVLGFYEQVGRNTDYILHPEEILADNFALIALGAQKVADPGLLRRLSEVLRAFAA